MFLEIQDLKKSYEQGETKTKVIYGKEAITVFVFLYLNKQIRCQ